MVQIEEAAEAIDPTSVGSRPRPRRGPASFARLLLVAIFAAAAIAPAMSAWADEPRFFRIGTAGATGTYFQIGGILASAISSPPGSPNCQRGGNCGVPGLIAVAQATQGSVENVDMIGRAQLESALSQADIASAAYRGNGIFRTKGAIASLRAIAALFPESIHIVVARDSPIKTLRDLKGKRVGLGEKESGTLADARIVRSSPAPRSPSMPIPASTARRPPSGSTRYGSSRPAFPISSSMRSPNRCGASRRGNSSPPVTSSADGLRRNAPSKGSTSRSIPAPSVTIARTSCSPTRLNNRPAQIGPSRSNPVLADEETKGSSGFGRFDEEMAGGAAEGGEILDRAGIGRQHLQCLAGRQCLERLARLEHRQRAKQALGIEYVAVHRVRSRSSLIAAALALVGRSLPYNSIAASVREDG